MSEVARKISMTNQVIFDVKGNSGWIILNRPEALNALSLEMVEAIYAQLVAWRDDSRIKAVVVTGEGDKAFCAGGDIRAGYEAAKQGKFDHMDKFFRTEYKMNTLIHEYPKPYIAILDGIAMGGGLGVSVHGSHRIVTERSILAMPETGIGFFPDVGATWFLSRGPDSTGVYIAMTGNRFDAADALYLGVATHYISSTKIPELIEGLQSTADHDSVIKSLSEELGVGDIETHADQISEHFSQHSVMEIIQSLESDTSEFANDCLISLRTKSPISIQVAFAQLRTLDPAATFRDVMKREFRMAHHFIQSRDFIEGVRALLVDKDKNPKWIPGKLEDVNESQVLRYFESLGDKELVF